MDKVAFGLLVLFFLVVGSFFFQQAGYTFFSRSDAAVFSRMPVRVAQPVIGKKANTSHKAKTNSTSLGFPGTSASSGGRVAGASIIVPVPTSSGNTATSGADGLAIITNATSVITWGGGGGGGSNPPAGNSADTEAPLVALLTPLNNSRVIGTAEVTATSSDNVGVVGVQFILDNSDFLGEVTSTPYSISISSAALSDGQHSLVARARDAAGNNASSSIVLFTFVSASTSIATTTATSSDAFTEGMVSLTFDDGFSSQYDEVLPVLASAGFKGTFYLITNALTNAIATNLVQNPSLETSDGSGNPVYWSRGDAWGTNDAAYFYPVPGMDGAAAAKLTITSYVDGDAKWFFNEVSPRRDARFRDYYNATAASILTVRYTFADGSYAYHDYVSLDATGNQWKRAEMTFPVPADVTAVTVFHRLASVGELSIDNVTLSEVTDYINPTQMTILQAEGHEIGAHTQTHTSLLSMPLADAEREITGSLSDLAGMGARDIKTFAYPYGNFSADIKTILTNAGFIAARGVEDGYNFKNTDKLELKTRNIDLTTTVEQVKAWIDEAVADKKWLIVTFHQVSDGDFAFGTTPEKFLQIVQYLKDNNVPVKTVREAVLLMNP